MEGSGEFFKSRKASRVESCSSKAAFTLVVQRAFHLTSPGERGTSPSLSELLATGHGRGVWLDVVPMIRCGGASMEVLTSSICTLLVILGCQ